ncbi:hypothetical protein AOD74_0204445 [Helicobacter pylori]|nr:hypothetical protein AOD74_0204445 [Helicobacter pylori]OKB26859.1 hypothetical protein AOD76_0204225 [Helicobacter pylori]GHP35143.1 hypothetical protein VN1180_02280 [Helicobacter pylori]GHP57362.1 hypothetical protein VN1193_00400 [Helicobacter pylori]
MISKTLPIPYEFYYQTKTKFKNKFLKVGKWLKNLKLKWAKARGLNYKLSKTFWAWPFALTL